MKEGIIQLATGGEWHRHLWLWEQLKLGSVKKEYQA